jgi:hypothetical protein
MLIIISFFSAIWSHLFLVYSNIITTIIALLRSNITYVHTWTSITLIGSPVLAHLCAYSIFPRLRRNWSLLLAYNEHRPKHRFLSYVSLTAGSLWLVVLFIVWLVPTHKISYAQASCTNSFSENTQTLRIVFFIWLFAIISWNSLGALFPKPTETIGSEP